MCLFGDFCWEVSFWFLVVDAYLLLCFIGDTYLTAGLLVNGEIVRRGDTLVRSVYWTTEYFFEETLYFGPFKLLRSPKFRAPVPLFMYDRFGLWKTLLCSFATSGL